MPVDPVGAAVLADVDTSTRARHGQGHRLANGCRADEGGQSSYLFSRGNERRCQPLVLVRQILDFRLQLCEPSLLPLPTLERSCGRGEVRDKARLTCAYTDLVGCARGSFFASPPLSPASSIDHQRPSSPQRRPLAS